MWILLLDDFMVPRLDDIGVPDVKIVLGVWTHGVEWRGMGGSIAMDRIE